MITFTKEQLIARINQVTAINKYRIGRDPAADGLAMDNELFAIALASLEAEPVYQFIYNNPYEEGYTEWLDCNKDYFNGVPEDCRRILYATPPAPVVDADDNFYSWFGREWHEHYQHNQYTTAAKQMLGVMAESAWKAGRSAAMHQGADGNSPVLPDGWVACSERMPKKGQEVLCTDQFENYETALYDTGYIPGPPFFATTDGEFHPTHWMPLPAAPQQEVGNG